MQLYTAFAILFIRYYERAKANVFKRAEVFGARLISGNVKEIVVHLPRTLNDGTLLAIVKAGMMY